MNNFNQKFTRPKAGLLLIASSRFRNLGQNLPRGTYHERKNEEVTGIIENLKESVDIVFPGIVFEKADVQQAMDLFFAEKVDFVVAEFLSWAEDFTWIRFLRDMPDIPIIFVNPAKERMTFTDTLDEDDFIDFLCAGTLVGSLEASGSVPRTGRKNVKVVMGSREEINHRISTFAKACKVRSILRQAQFGLLANFNEVMWSTYFDPYNLFTRIGPELRFVTYSSLADEIKGVSDEETKIYVDELISRYRVMDDVDRHKLFESARGSIGIARLSERLGIDAMVYNDIDPAMFKLIGLRPGFYHPFYNENLSVLVPEGDIGAGLITFIMKLLSRKHVNFIEPFHVEAAENTFAGGHAGPNDHTDPDYEKSVIIARDVRFAKTSYKYAGAPFAWYRIPPGRKTMAQLVENGGSYKLVCALVDSLKGDHLFATYSHTIFRPLIPVKDFFEKILRIGTTQHFAVTDGDYRTELALLAELMGFEYHEIV